MQAVDIKASGKSDVCARIQDEEEHRQISGTLLFVKHYPGIFSLDDLELRS